MGTNYVDEELFKRANTVYQTEFERASHYENLRSQFTNLNIIITGGIITLLSGKILGNVAAAAFLLILAVAAFVITSRLGDAFMYHRRLAGKMRYVIMMGHQKTRSKHRLNKKEHRRRIGCMRFVEQNLLWVIVNVSVPLLVGCFAVISIYWPSFLG